MCENDSRDANRADSSSNRRKFLTTAGALTTAALVAGCSGGDGGGDGGGGTGNTPTKTTQGKTEPTEVVIAMPHYGLFDISVGYMVGKEKGFFRDEGIKLSKVDTAGGGETVRSTTGGDAHIGFGSGVMGAFAAIRQGSGVRIVGNEWNNVTDVFWISKGDSKYETLEDCTDASIGFSSPGASSHMMALRAIQHANLENAEPKAVGGPPDSFTAVKTGEVDVSWVIPPFFSKEIQQGDFQRVFLGGNIPPFGNMTIRGHLSTKKWLQNNSDTAKAFFRAYTKTIDWSYNNLDETAKIWANVLDRSDPDFLKGIIEDYYPKENLEIERLKNLQKAVELAKEFDFIDSTLSEEDLKKAVDLSHLPDDLDIPTQYQ